MILVIKGEDKKLKALAKELSIKIKRNKLTSEFISEPDQNMEDKLTAKEIKELIENAETIEDLKEFESDSRQIVKSAYNKKLKELSNG